MLSALADLGTLLFLFLIGRRLYSPWVGLLAAALYALAALPIQQSHFYTVDSFATFWIAAAGYFTVRIA
jgi:4-amino-4-deoxy-L-arabinose transferase-like glycosyltransferase